MLKVMRSNKFFTVFLLGGVSIMITIVFIFWGIGPQQNPSEAIVAEVEKSKITFSEYDRAYQIAYRRARDTYEDEKQIENLNLRVAVLDELIDGRVLAFTADKSGVKVTEDEIRKAVMSEPAFQKDGLFNKEIYERRLKLNRMTPSVFESQLRNDLLLNKMRRLFGETAELGAEELSILESVKDNQGQFRNAFLTAKRNLAVKAYVEGLKRRLEITVNDGYISY
jgi:peptidyl-prolyl cis-trans isomerase D